MSGDYMQGDKDNAVTVPFTDDQTEAAKPDDLDEDKPDATPEERRSRSQKRTERINRLLNEGKQSKEELAALRAAAAQTQAELERLKGYIGAQEQERNRARDNGKDPYEEQLDKVYARQSEAYNSAQAEIKSGTFTPERQKHYEQIAREVESEKTRIHANRVLAQSAGALRESQARLVWEQKYPEVYSNQKAFEYAKATWARRLALGESQSNALADEVMSETMNAFKLGSKPAPTASDRARLSGLPAAGSGGGKPSGIVMTPELKKMAEAAHPDMPQAEAWKQWANGPGKRLREKKVL